MAIEDINLGTAPNDGTGDPLRVAGQKINDNNADFQQQIDNIINIEESPSSIKQKYESNPDTNNFNDSAKQTVANQSGVNTGDETTSTIQTKRPLKTVNGETLEGTGDIPFPSANGDMLKSVYDVNDDGIVDKAQSVIFKTEISQAVQKGNLLYAVGRNQATGNPIAGLADNTVSFADKTIGMALEDGAGGSVIEVVKNGLIEDLDTSLFAVGETIYLSNNGTFDQKSNITSGVFNPVGFVVLSAFSNGAIIIDTSATESIDTDNTINNSNVSGRTVTEALNELLNNSKPYYDRYIPDLYLANQTTRALANQQNNVFEQYGEGLTFLCPQTDNYRLDLVWVWSINVNNQSAIFRISVIEDGGTPNELITFKIEAKEIGGTGEVVDVIENNTIVGTTNTGTDTRDLQTAHADFNLTEGVEYKWIIEYLAEGTTPTALTIYTAQTSIEQKTIKIN